MFAIWHHFRLEVQRSPSHASGVGCSFQCLLLNPPNRLAQANQVFSKFLQHLFYTFRFPNSFLRRLDQAFSASILHRRRPPGPFPCL